MKIVFFMIFITIFLSCQKKETEYNPTFGDSKPSSKKTYFLAVHPLHNPKRMQEMYEPIIQLLNKNFSDAKFVLESSKDYSDYNQKIKLKSPHFLLPNPYQTILAQKEGYKVFAKMGNDENFRGLILINKDSSFKKVKDLKGKRISFPAPSALAAAMMPKVYMEENGLKVSKNEAELKYVGSQESSILAVFHGEVQAGVTWPMVWNSYSKEMPELKAKLKVLAVTEKLINNSLMFRDDVPSDVVFKVKQTFLTLHQNEEGKKILEKMSLSNFEESQNQDYEVVNIFLNKYKKIFGELPL